MIGPSTGKFLATTAQNQCSGAVLGHGAPTLFGRSLQLIDLQNCFCEIAKYARVAHPEFNLERIRIKILYTPDPGKVRSLPQPFFPPKWEINAICNQVPRGAEVSRFASRGQSLVAMAGEFRFLEAEPEDNPETRNDPDY
jgi:hypothetical protein